jgi:hypothetical protein
MAPNGRGACPIVNGMNPIGNGTASNVNGTRPMGFDARVAGFCSSTIKDIFLAKDG